MARCGWVRCRRAGRVGVSLGVAGKVRRGEVTGAVCGAERLGMAGAACQVRVRPGEGSVARQGWQVRVRQGLVWPGWDGVAGSAWRGLQAWLCVVGEPWRRGVPRDDGRF